MLDIYTAITESTCGEACWSAREDICRCACGNKNHGVLRDVDGVKPLRTRKLNGFMYQLLAVETPGASCMAVGSKPLEELKGREMKRISEAGLWGRYQYDSTPGYPVKLKTATDSEIKRWDELHLWRTCQYWRPLVAWIRADLA